MTGNGVMIGGFVIQGSEPRRWPWLAPVPSPPLSASPLAANPTLRWCARPTNRSWPPTTLAKRRQRGATSERLRASRRTGVAPFCDVPRVRTPRFSPRRRHDGRGLCGRLQNEVTAGASMYTRLRLRGCPPLSKPASHRPRPPRHGARSHEQTAPAARPQHPRRKPAAAQRDRMRRETSTSRVYVTHDTTGGVAVKFSRTDGQEAWRRTWCSVGNGSMGGGITVGLGRECPLHGLRRPGRLVTSSILRQAPPWEHRVAPPSPSVSHVGIAIGVDAAETAGRHDDEQRPKSSPCQARPLGGNGSKPSARAGSW